MDIKLIYSFLLFFTISISCTAQFTTVTYKDDHQLYEGLMLKPKRAKKAVLILPAWKGIDNEAKQAALALKKEGYMVFIADIYGIENIPKTNEDAKKLSTHYKENFQSYQHNIQLALNEFIKQGADKDNIAVIGYCFGGTGALEVARADFHVKGIVSIHGGLYKDAARENNQIKTKVLVLHGAEDKSVPETQVESFRNEMKSTKADWQLIYYANCGHTWTNPEGTDYNQLMAERAWKHVLLFLQEVL